MTTTSSEDTAKRKAQSGSVFSGVHLGGACARVGLRRKQVEETLDSMEATLASSEGEVEKRQKRTCGLSGELLSRGQALHSDTVLAMLKMPERPLGAWDEGLWDRASDLLGRTVAFVKGSRFQKNCAKRLGWFEKNKEAWLSSSADLKCLEDDSELAARPI